MDFAATPIQKARETYWMHELQTIFPYGLNDRIGDKFKTDNKHINVAAKFHLCQENIFVLIVGKIIKVFPFFYTTTIFKWFKSYAEHLHQRCS